MKKLLILAAMFCTSFLATAQHDVETHGAVKLEVYPNPFVESLIISSESESGYVNIYTLDGKCLFTDKYESKEFELSLPEIPVGIYLLVLYTDERERLTRKIVK